MQSRAEQMDTATLQRSTALHGNHSILFGFIQVRRGLSAVCFHHIPDQIKCIIIIIIHSVFLSFYGFRCQHPHCCHSVRNWKDTAGIAFLEINPCQQSFPQFQVSVPDALQTLIIWSPEHQSPPLTNLDHKKHHSEDTSVTSTSSA